MWYKVYVFLEFQAKFRNNLKKFSEFWKGFVNLDHLVFGGRPIYINYVTTSWSCNVVQSYDNYGVSSQIQESITIRGFVNQECCMISALMMTFLEGGQFIWQHQHHEVTIWYKVVTIMEFQSKFRNGLQIFQCFWQMATLYQKTNRMCNDCIIQNHLTILQSTWLINCITFLSL